jgi:hypothetical protein
VHVGDGAGGLRLADAVAARADGSDDMRAVTIVERLVIDVRQVGVVRRLRGRSGRRQVAVLQSRERRGHGEWAADQDHQNPGVGPVAPPWATTE